MKKFWLDLNHSDTQAFTPAAPHMNRLKLTALYTLTRFQGEGVAVELVGEILQEAKARRLRYVFACTSEERAARFFQRMKFRRVGPGDISAAKWRGYEAARVARLFSLLPREAKVPAAPPNWAKSTRGRSSASRSAWRSSA